MLSCNWMVQAIRSTGYGGHRQCVNEVSCPSKGKERMRRTRSPNETFSSGYLCADLLATLSSNMQKQKIINNL